MDLSDGWLVDLQGSPLAYAEAWALQRELLRARQNGLIPDVLLLLEHRPVVTMGRSGEAEHLLMPRSALTAQGIEFFEVERGGSATYHGPGQLVGYPIIDLRRLDDDVARFMRLLEETVVATLAAYGIAGRRRHGYPGVWVDGAKICAVGVAVKRHVTMHGFALNVTTDLGPFDLINPCGLGMPVTSMARLLGHPVPLTDVRRTYAAHFSDLFRLTLQPRDLTAAPVHPAPAHAAS